MYFLKRVKHLLYGFRYLIKSKFIFRNPLNSDIIIFDPISAKELELIFSESKPFLLNSRINLIREIYISEQIILFMLKNFFKRSIKQNYLLIIINLINPKVLVTNIDTSKDFHILAKILHKKIRFISLQQGDRSMPDGPYSDTKKFNLNNYFIPEFFVFSDYDIKNFKSTNAKIGTFQVAGSIKSFYAKTHFDNNSAEREKKYDVCLISDPVFNNPENNPTSFIAQFLQKISLNHNLKIVIAGANFKDTKEGKLEVNLYNQLCKDNKFFIKQGEKNSYSSYLTLLQSNLVIGHNSTLLREAVALGKKILACNSHNYPQEGLCNLDIFSFYKENEIIKCKPKYNAFENFQKILLRLIQLDHGEYFKSINKDYIMPFLNTPKIIQDSISKSIK